MYQTIILFNMLGAGVQVYRALKSHRTANFTP